MWASSIVKGQIAADADTGLGHGLVGVEVDRKRCLTGTSPDKRYSSKLEMMVVSSSISAKVTSAPYG